RELSSAIFLYTTGTQVLSVLLFDKSDEGNFEMLSSIGLVLVVVTVALVMLGFRVVGRDFMLRRASTYVADAAPSKLVLRALTCRFGTVTAVDRATLALARGEFVSLLGPSGCGKTR